MNAEGGDLPLAPGTRIGPYVVESYLARGAMGMLLRAQDSMLDRPVALKVIDPRFADQGDFRARFERECKVLARLRHPSVVTIYYYGEHLGAPFFAMELVEGTDLETLLARSSRIPWRQAVSWMRQCCQGLAAARAEGIIHRDLKPANLLLDSRDCIRIVDFGLAKGQGQGVGAQVTAASMMVGTPHYMSPEQARGEELDWRSDLYSLGATFHHLLAGETVFDSESAMEVVARHIREVPPRLASRRADLPPALSGLIDGLLEKLPRARGFESYEEVVQALDGILQGSSPARAPARTMVHATPPELVPGGGSESGPGPGAARGTGPSPAPSPSGATRVNPRPPAPPPETRAPAAPVPPAPTPAGTSASSGAPPSAPTPAGTSASSGAPPPAPTPAGTRASPTPVDLPPSPPRRFPGEAYGWLEVDPEGTGEPPPEFAHLGDVVLVSALEARFGTDPENALYLPFSPSSKAEKRVSGKGGHGCLCWTPEGFQLRTLRHRSSRGRPGGLVNEVRLDGGVSLEEGSYAIRPGSRIDLRGQYLLFLGGSLEGGLRVTCETLEETSALEIPVTWAYVLLHRELILGSSPVAGVLLPADRAPDRVLGIEVRHGEFWVTPRAEGVRLDGRPLEEAAVLESGSLLEGPGLRYFFRAATTPEDLWT